MTKKTTVLILLILLLAAGAGGWICWKNVPGEEDYMAEVLAYQEEQKEAFAEGVIRQLQEEIVFGDQDVVTFNNGYLEAIDIKTHETAEMLFACIRNCVQITDLTGVNLKPMELPIEINGRGTGTFQNFYATYQETGQFIGISFSPEDSQSFYDYVMALP